MIQAFEAILLLFIGLIAGIAFQHSFEFGSNLVDWQTLIGASLALIGAFATVKIIREQIAETKKIEHSRVERKVRAARASMSDAINGVMDYTRECYSYIEDRQERLPDKPNQHIYVFKNAIEFIDGDTGDALYELVSFFQVYNARIDGYSHSPIGEYPSHEMILDTAELNWLAMRLFDFARNEADSVSLRKATSEEMLSALRSIVRTERFYNQQIELRPVIETIKRRYA